MAWQPERMSGHYYIIGANVGSFAPKFSPSGSGFYPTSQAGPPNPPFGRYTSNPLPYDASVRGGLAAGRFGLHYANPLMVGTNERASDAEIAENTGSSETGEQAGSKYVFLRARGLRSLIDYELLHAPTTNRMNWQVLASQYWRLSPSSSWTLTGYRYWDETNKNWLLGSVGFWAVSGGFWFTDSQLSNGVDLADLHVRTTFLEYYREFVGESEYYWATNVYTGQEGCSSIFWNNFVPYCRSYHLNSNYYRGPMVTNYWEVTNWVSEGNVAFYIGSRRVVSGAAAGYELFRTAGGRE